MEKIYINLKADMVNFTKFTKYHDRFGINLTTIQQFECHFVNDIAVIIIGTHFVLWANFNKTNHHR